MNTRFAGTLAMLILMSSAGVSQVLLKRVVTKDVPVGTMAYAVTNRESRDVVVCMTDDLRAHDSYDPAPFYLEQYQKGGWHVVLGSDVAMHVTVSMKGGEQQEFHIATPTPGRYRLVLQYTFDLAALNDRHCETLNVGKSHTLRSKPFDVPGIGIQ